MAKLRANLGLLFKKRAYVYIFDYSISCYVLLSFYIRVNFKLLVSFNRLKCFNIAESF